MIIDGFSHQLPDTNPAETQEWLESIDAVMGAEGPSRARFLMAKLIERAREQGVGVPASVSTPYINTIPVEGQEPMPGSNELERRIKSLVRWNALAMVVRANREEAGIGGHISTYASAVTLYEVGFNHFFRARNQAHEGDIIYF